MRIRAVFFAAILGASSFFGPMEVHALLDELRGLAPGQISVNPPVYNTTEIVKGQSTHIVKGTVLDVTSFWDDGSIYSIAEIRAKEWLKNRADHDVLLLRYRGGIVGGVQQIVIPGVWLTGEMEATMYLKHEGENRYEALWGMEEGGLYSSATSDFEPGGWGYSLIPRVGGAIGPYFWENPTVTFTPNFDRGTSDTDGEWDAVRAGFDTWNRAGSTIGFVLGPHGDCEPGKHDEGLGPPVSCIGWVSAISGNFIAQVDFWTCPFFERTTCDDGTINELDIRLNDGGYVFSLNPTGNEVDIQGTITHELGHALGLNDFGSDGSPDELQTMFKQRLRTGLGVDLLSTGTLMDRSLFWGDLAGVRYVYPRQYTVAPGQWLGSYTEGGDLALADIDFDGYPEIVFLWVDAPDGANKIHYKIGRALNFQAIGEVLAWETTLFEKPGWVGDYSQGAGVAIADINRNFYPDMVVAWVNDKPLAENDVHYQIGWDLQYTGEASGWSQVFTGAERIGSYTAGLAAALEDVNNNSNLDLVLSWMDNPSGRNTVAYEIRWDVQATGESTSPSTRVTLFTGTDGIDAETNGHGIAFSDFNNDGLRDLILAWGVLACESGYCLTVSTEYRVGWNVGSNGTPESKTTTDRHIPGGWRVRGPLGALGVSTWDINENGRPDMVFLWKEPGETDSASYVVEWESAFVNIAPKQDDAGQPGDAGNSWANATAASSGRGYLIGQDGLGDVEDWYKFPVCSGDRISARLNAPVAVDFDLYLWDSDGFPRATRASRGDGDETITLFTADRTGEWRIRITILGVPESLVAPSIGIYSFSVTGMTSPPCPVIIRPNGDGISEWTPVPCNWNELFQMCTTPRYSTVDDPVIQPGTPDLTDYIEAVITTTTFQQKAQAFALSNIEDPCQPQGSRCIRRLDLWIYMEVTVSGLVPEGYPLLQTFIQMTVGGVAYCYYQLSGPQLRGWYLLSCTTVDGWNATEVNQLGVEVRFQGVSGATQVTRIYALYILVVP